MKKPNNINSQIEIDIDRIKLIRVSRIKTAKRLEKYDNSWKIILLIYNIEAVISVLVGFFAPNKVSTPVISGIVSISVILLQDFVAGRDYKNRSSNLHYQQLGMKNLISKLQRLLLNNKLTEEQLLDKYSNICNEYQAILLGYENHDDLDFINAKIELDIIHDKEKKIFL